MIMQKRSFIITIIVLIIVVGGIAGFFYLYINKGVPEAGTGANATDRNLFPFGTGVAKPSQNGTITATSSGVTVATTNIAFSSSLRQLSLVPVAGATAFLTGSTTIIRYMERGTGHIYEQEGESLTQTRISNKTIPKVYNTFWGNNGNSMILRFVDGDIIKTYAAELSTPKTGIVDPKAKEVSGSFLIQNIKDVALSPLKGRMLYFTTDGSESVGVVAPLTGRGPATVFTSPFREWQIDWPKENFITLTTKPSGLYQGVAYTLNPDTKTLTKLIDRIFGLTIKANSTGTMFLYSNSDRQRESLSLNLFRLGSGEQSELLIRTLPEKCVWSVKEATVVYCAAPSAVSPALYPDAWYQGNVAFSDHIWKFDTTTETLSRMADLQTLTNLDIDATDLTLSPKEDYLLFTNKNDLTLWMLKLT